MSGRTVLAVRGRRTVVVKGPVRPAEEMVAGSLGDDLRRHGVRLPRTLAVVTTSDDGTWLVLEHVPDALPRGRWGADRDVVQVLQRFHALPPTLLDGLPDRYRPRWDDAMTDSALTALESSSDTRSAISDAQRRAEVALVGNRVISGDPNPMNWRVGAHGDPVPLDLERITLGAPALDLAILLPGLPARADAERLVTQYAALGGDAVAVGDVMVAKAFTVVELAAGSLPGTAAREAVHHLSTQLGAWLHAEVG